MNYYRMIEFIMPNNKKGYAIALNRKEFDKYISIINKYKYPTTIYTYDSFDKLAEEFERKSKNANKKT